MNSFKKILYVTELVSIRQPSGEAESIGATLAVSRIVQEPTHE